MNCTDSKDGSLLCNPRPDRGNFFIPGKQGNSAYRLRGGLPAQQLFGWRSAGGWGRGRRQKWGGQMREKLYRFGVEWEHGEESWWRSAYSFQHRVGVEFIRQSKWWGNNRHSSSSPCKGQTVKRTAPHMLCPTKAFKAEHCMCVTQALTKAYTRH